jgi:hypothetical protein
MRITQIFVRNTNKEMHYESKIISKTNVRKVQGNKEKRQSNGNLREPKAQAETGLISIV